MDYASLGKSPISEDQPTGGDCRYAVEFENLQAEIDKLSSPTAEGKVDWSKVVQTAAGILERQSKDLTVASYLAVGLVNHLQIEGLDQGLLVIQNLVENYWDNLYPPKKRMRGRMGAFNWWTEKTGETLSNTRHAPIPADLSERILGTLKALALQLEDKLPEPLSLRPLERAIEAIPVKKAPAAAKPEQAADATTASSGKTKPLNAKPVSTPAPAPLPTSAIESDQDALKSIEAALQQMRQPSLFLLQNDLSNFLAYRYRRIACWAAITALPPSSDGATLIPAPPPQLAADLAILRDEGNWPGLIQNCEQKISQYIFWFDLHFMVAQGLKKMGVTHRKALDEVCREAAYLLQRFPGVQRLTFEDGTPFADPQTRKWLKSIGFGEAGSGPTDNGGAQSGPDALVEDKTQQALAMARKKRLADAVGLLQEEMQRAPAHRDKMLWRLAIIQVLLAVKKSQLALPHIERVLSDIDAFDLETWDPQMALQGLTAAWKGFNAQNVSAYQKRGMEILNRISANFPAEALRIGQ